MKLFFISQIKAIQMIIILLLFLHINSKDISKCSIENGLTNKTCFNNLIHLDNYSSGQFAGDKNGNMFILYSGSNSDNKANRTFYVLKKDGTNYFSDGFQKVIQIIPEGSAEGRNESRIIFISPPEDKQYLFSTSAGEPSLTLTELYNIGENEITSSSSKNTKDFWNINEEEISSYQYSLIKVPNNNIYFFAFAQQENIILIKFKFTSQNLNNYHEIKNITLNDNCNNRIISFFLMEQHNILVLFYVKEIDYCDYGWCFPVAIYSRTLYNDNLEKKNEQQGGNWEINLGDEVFFKGIYLKDNYAAFIFCMNFIIFIVLD